MKPSPRRVMVLLAWCVASTSLAQAHPGHEDGHELTWDFNHLVQHPFATIACFAVLGAAVWAGWRMARHLQLHR